MSADKNLNETLNEVIGESIRSNEGSSINETEKGISSESTSSETDSGETLEKVEGIDISDIPEQDRPRIKKALEDKFKLVNKGVQEKFQEIAGYKKERDELVKMGLTAEEATTVLKEHLQKKQNPTTTNDTKEKSVRLLDKLIEQSPYEQRPALEQMRQIILEETDVSTLKKELSEIKSALGFVSQSAVKTKEREVNQELDTTWSDKLGKEFIDKHRERLVSVALKFPNEPLSKIIKIETPDDEYEQAILSKRLGNKKPLTEEKKNAITSATKTVSSMDKIDTKGKSLKDILVEAVMKK